MKIAIIIQARLGSTRLPRKMMLDFYQGKGILEVIVDRLLLAKLGLDIIIGTTDKKEDDIIEKLAKRKNVFVFRGDENNVLKRFIDAAEEYDVKKIIRICADNPFLDMDALKYMIEENINADYDYWCYQINKKPTILTHFGYWAEATMLNALHKIIKTTDNKMYLEHVTNYIYLNSKEFNVRYNELDFLYKEENNIRLTIDTLNDFKVAKEVYISLIDKRIKLSPENIFLLIEQNPKWQKQMQKEIQKNEK